ncbi:MAG: extracellular solute-binding protein family 5, partial [Chloroflexi bacterium]|nr:extracellular solute-binding protein family 5 [Chloroflexota bacterium]
MGIFSRSASGGWYAVNELHSSALVTTDYSNPRVIGRLAERAPSFEDGTITLLPDGRMRVVFHLRKDVTWQDGVPFTADDLTFSFQFMSDQGIPNQQPDVINLIQTVEAPDPYTFVVDYRSAY